MFPYGKMRVSLGFAAGRGQNPFARKQAIHIIMTQTRDRIQILGFLPALGKGKESLSEQLAGTDIKMHRY